MSKFACQIRMSKCHYTKNLEIKKVIYFYNIFVGAKLSIFKWILCRIDKEIYTLNRATKKNNFCSRSKFVYLFGFELCCENASRHVISDDKFKICIFPKGTNSINFFFVGFRWPFYGCVKNISKPRFETSIKPCGMKPNY